MKYFCKWTLAALLILLIPLTSIGTAETLRVMLHSGSFPPYFFEEGDSRSGTIRDIFSALAKETGDTIEFIRIPFKRALQQFETGQIDIEPMVNPIWRGDSSVPGIYSIPYTQSEEIILFSSNKAIPANSPADLIGKKLGVIKGYSYPEFEDFFADSRIVKIPLRDENQIIQLLLSKRLEQACINKDFALYQIRNQHLEEKLKAGKPYSTREMMIRFHPSKKDTVPRFNKAIEKLLREGIIEKIYASYR